MSTQDFTYVVEGHWQFPLDMLRKDGSRPATEADRALVERLSKDLAEFLDESMSPEERRADRTRKHRIRLVIPDATRFQRPVIARWESLGWEVVESSDPLLVPVHVADKAARVAEGRRKDLVASALAKLAPEEAQAVMEHFSRLGAANAAA